MKPSTALRKAAAWCDKRRGIGGCTAIYDVTTDSDDEAAMSYFDLFNPARSLYSAYWFGRPHVGPRFWGNDTTPEQHNHRILSLLMAASIAESEGQ